MMRKACVAGLLILLVGMVASSQTNLNLTPRAFETVEGVVYLFDNATGASQTTLVLVLSGAINLAPEDVIVFGGGEVTSITLFGEGTVAAIEVDVVAGGTIQIAFSGDNAALAIKAAWFPIN
ncbi:hypothetical protein ACFLSZ_03700 [Candidatus Bipolaricaulota bacterium]